MKYLLVALFSITASSSFAQDKVFTFSHTQVRNSKQQWVDKKEKQQQTVLITNDKIQLQVSDQQYQLSIVNTTHLPDNGIIYLCKDSKLHNVTVMLISDLKMYLYDDSKRYLINFSQPVVMND